MEGKGHFSVCSRQWGVADCVRVVVIGGGECSSGSTVMMLMSFDIHVALINSCTGRNPSARRRRPPP